MFSPSYKTLKVCLVGVIIVSLFLLTFLVRAKGLAWEKFHADEIQIGEWLRKSEGKISFCERVYPNGFFILIKPYVFIEKSYYLLKRKWNSFVSLESTQDKYSFDPVLTVRWFNLWLGTFAVIVFFLTFLKLTSVFLPSILATAFLAFSPYIVEHNHYAETDIAALFTLSAFLFFITYAIKTQEKRYLYIACFTAGFAAGTKFILFLLLPVILYEAFLYGYRISESQKYKNAIEKLLIGFLFFALGLVVTNPDMVIRPLWFLKGLGYEKWRVYYETDTIFSEAIKEGKYLIYLHNLKKFLDFSRSWNLLFLLLMTLSVSLYFWNELRRYFSILVVFPILFLFYWIFFAPFVRSQEFIIILPFVASYLAIAITIVLQRKRFFVQAVTVILASMIVAIVFKETLVVSQIFGWKDTRTLVNEWFKLCFPKNAIVGSEQYARHTLRGFKMTFLVDRIERHNLSGLLFTNKVDYFVRAPSIGGRGIYHPLTKKLYPFAERNYSDFTNNCTLLARWSILTPEFRPTFVSPMIELYACRRFDQKLCLEIEPQQPAVVPNINENPIKNVTFFPANAKIGPAIALLIDKIPRTIGIGGPSEDRNDTYIVLTTMERSATVNVKWKGERRKISLAPYDVAVVPITEKSSFWQKEPFQLVTVYAEEQKDIVYIPVFLRVVFSPSQVYRICLENGRPERIPNELLREDIFTNLPHNLFLEFAAHSNQVTIKNDLLDGLQLSLEKASNLSPEEILLKDINAYYFEQFANIDLLKILSINNKNYKIFTKEDKYIRLLSFLDLYLKKDEAISNTAIAKIQLPVLVSRGKYILKSSILLSQVDTNTIPLTLYFDGCSNEVVNALCEPNIWYDFSISLTTYREKYPVLVFESATNATIYVKELKLSWNTKDVLATISDEVKELKKDVLLQSTSFHSDTNEIVFPPWVKLVDCKFRRKSEEIECIFETLRRDIPPLALAFYIKKHNRWRYKGKVSLGISSDLPQATQLHRVFKLNEELFSLANCDWNKIGIGLVSDVEWHPGKILLSNSQEAVPIVHFISDGKQ